MSDKALRKHLLELLDGKSGHIDIDSALADFPLDGINTVVDGSPHTAWQLLEHIRIAQWDILEFCRDPKHKSPPWPGGYWPQDDGTRESWKRSAGQVLAGLESFRAIAGDDSIDLF